MLALMQMLMMGKSKEKEDKMTVERMVLDLMELKGLMELMWKSLIQDSSTFL